MSDSSGTIKLFLVDESMLAYAGLAAILSSQPDIEIVGRAGTALSTTEPFPDAATDVVVVSALSRSVDISGAIRRISHAHEHGAARIMLLASDVGDPVYLEAARLGVGGIIRSTDEPQVFLAAIRVIASGYSVVPMSRVAISPEPARPAALPSPLRSRPQPVLLPSVSPASAAPSASSTSATSSASSAEWAALLGTLTRREREVLHWLARGLKNGEIAAKLVLSESTVKSHVQNVLMKLGLRNRASAVAFYYERISPGDEP
jgi:DNA-binding NarL/FixJ family response regulator